TGAVGDVGDLWISRFVLRRGSDGRGDQQERTGTCNQITFHRNLHRPVSSRFAGDGDWMVPAHKGSRNPSLLRTACVRRLQRTPAKGNASSSSGPIRASTSRLTWKRAR